MVTPQLASKLNVGMPKKVPGTIDKFCSMFERMDSTIWPDVCKNKTHAEEYKRFRTRIWKCFCIRPKTLRKLPLTLPWRRQDGWQGELSTGNWRWFEGNVVLMVLLLVCSSVCVHISKWEKQSVLFLTVAPFCTNTTRFHCNLFINNEYKEELLDSSSCGRILQVVAMTTCSVRV